MKKYHHTSINKKILITKENPTLYEDEGGK